MCTGMSFIEKIPLNLSNTTATYGTTMLLSMKDILLYTITYTFLTEKTDGLRGVKKAIYISMEGHPLNRGGVV